MSKIRLALPIIFLLILTAIVLDLANPLFDKPARDGGFFLYAGSQILNGKIPYIDFWDSKGPAIFYINAFGLLLGGGSRWGVWAVEFVCIFGTLLILYWLLVKRWGAGAALFGVTMAGLGLRIALGYGNYTEEYALLFNAAGLYLFLSIIPEEKSYWKYFWIGALFGLSFTFRANNIGGLFAILAAVFLFHAFKKDLLEVARIIIAALVGFATPLLLWMVFFALLNGAGDMIYASIIFNFSYAAAQERTWLDLFGGFGRYGISWYGWFTLAAWFVVVLRALNNFMLKKTSVFEIFLLFWFPFEIFLSNLSGRSFTHYYISWALAVAVYCAFIFAELWQLTFKVSPLESWHGGLCAYVSAVLVIVLFAAFPSFGTRYSETLSRFFTTPNTMDYVDPLAVYIHENTRSDDLVLMWYPEMGLSFMADRTSPVKYVYYPLFLEGSLTNEIESSYIEDLTSHPPQLIVDCSLLNNSIPSLDVATRKQQYSIPGARSQMYVQPGMKTIFDFVKENYYIKSTIKGCLIFTLNNS